VGGGERIEGIFAARGGEPSFVEPGGERGNEGRKRGSGGQIDRREVCSTGIFLRRSTHYVPGDPVS